MDYIPIHEKAVLIRLSMSQWSGRKYDSQISKQVEEQYNATNAGRWNKVLVPITAIKELTQLTNEARRYHYYHTLPWSDEGARLCPSVLFLDHKLKLNEYERMFWGKVQNFKDHYEEYKLAAKQFLNGMYKETDYPPLSELSNKFNFQITVSPIANSSDFRNTLVKSEYEKISRQYDDMLQSAVQNAMKDVWTRLYTVIKHMADKLKDEDAIFRDSLVGNIVQLTQLLPKLNVANDTGLESMRKEIERQLADSDPTRLREDNSYREDTAKKAQEIVDKMRCYI